MLDWKVGDKVVCINAVPNISKVQYLEEDKIYVISGFNTRSRNNILGVYLEGVTNSGSGWDGYGVNRFRKVVPDKHEPATDAEFLTLMGKAKAASRQLAKV